MPMTIISTNSVRRLNLNQRRFGFVSVMAVQFTAAAECRATRILLPSLWFDFHAGMAVRHPRSATQVRPGNTILQVWCAEYEDSREMTNVEARMTKEVRNPKLEMGNTNSLKVAARRVLERCADLAGCTQRTGEITRLFCSDAMRKAHGKLRRWMEAAGLRCRLDPAGNLIGRLESPISNGDPRRRVLLLRWRSGVRRQCRQIRWRFGGDAGAGGCGIDCRIESRVTVCIGRDRF